MPAGWFRVRVEAKAEVLALLHRAWSLQGSNGSGRGWVKVRRNVPGWDLWVGVLRISGHAHYPYPVQGGVGEERRRGEEEKRRGERIWEPSAGRSRLAAFLLMGLDGFITFRKIVPGSALLLLVSSTLAAGQATEQKTRHRTTHALRQEPIIGNTWNGTRGPTDLSAQLMRRSGIKIKPRRPCPCP